MKKPIKIVLTCGLVMAMIPFSACKSKTKQKGLVFEDDAYFRATQNELKLNLQSSKNAKCFVR